MFDALIVPLQAPCQGCAERHPACWSSCPRYAAYRTALDRLQTQRTAQRAVDEAGVLRGDKIRRDVHKYGLYERKKRWN